MAREIGSETRYNFREMTALVVDGNDFARSFTRNILASFRFREILTAATPRAGMTALNAQRVDVVFTEWYLGPVTGGTFVKKIRTLNIVRDNQVPVIVLTAGAQTEAVIDARDSGASDFVSRPLALYTFLPRMTQVIASPRPFVRSATYCGPDRRRKQQPIAFADRRNRPANETVTDGSPLIQSLVERVRQPGGLTIGELATNGEKVIAHEATRYAGVCREDIQDVISAVRALRTPGCDAPKLAAHIFLKAHDLRGMGETFGFPLLSAAGASLCNMLRNLPPDRALDPIFIQGLETHAMVMNLVVSENIRNDGGTIGAELMAGLGAISAKVCADCGAASSIAEPVRASNNR